MNIYHYHPDTGVYLGTGVADESPLEPGAFLIPAYATKDVPPVVPEGKYLVFENGWVLKDIPIPEPEPEPTAEEILASTKAQKLAEIQSELSSLDAYIPRGLEDTWALLSTDTTQLPTVQQERLARKVALRAAYNAIDAATTLDAVNAVTY